MRQNPSRDPPRAPDFAYTYIYMCVCMCVCIYVIYIHIYIGKIGGSRARKIGGSRARIARAKSADRAGSRERNRRIARAKSADRAGLRERNRRIARRNWRRSRARNPGLAADRARGFAVRATTLKYYFLGKYSKPPSLGGVVVSETRRSSGVAPRACVCRRICTYIHTAMVYPEITSGEYRPRYVSGEYRTRAWGHPRGVRIRGRLGITRELRAGVS